MTAIVTSYINPDLDGVACCIAIQALEPPDWTASMLGATDSETKLVLKTLGLALPQPITGWTDISAIWLVDTHHPKQLPDDFPAQIVRRITDHHSGGSPECFSDAEVQNEAVGAAATLLAERFDRQRARIRPNIAVLLQAAIASNTLQFRAPATSQRDHRAYEFLAGIRPIDSTLLEGMREARRERLTLASDALLESDVKLFGTLRGIAAIAQIEAPGALDILLRDDLRSSLKRLSAAARPRRQLPSRQPGARPARPAAEKHTRSRYLHPRPAHRRDQSEDAGFQMTIADRTEISRPVRPKAFLPEAV